MAKKKTVEEEKKKVELFRGKWSLPKNFPEDKFDLLNDRFEVIEKWEEERRELNLSFNEQFRIDVYAVAVMMSEDDSFKGKFNPQEIYQEMCDTMKEMRKGKKDYSLFDEVKMIEKVMDKHRKKTATKK